MMVKIFGIEERECVELWKIRIKIRFRILITWEMVLISQTYLIKSRVKKNVYIYIYIYKDQLSSRRG